MQQLIRSSAAAVALAFTLSATPAAASSALADRKGSMRGGLNAQALERELANAVGEALGCGGQVDAARLEGIRRKLEPMWGTLPKNSGGNVDRRSLRYLVHRHFNRQSAIHVRGFEPSRPMSASGWGSADILSQSVPGFVESVLESRHKAESGFNLGDAAHVVAALEQLIFDAEGTLLAIVWEDRGLAADKSLTRTEVGALLETYIVFWMLGEDWGSAEILVANQTLLEQALPHWHQLAAFARGQADGLDHRRRSSPATAFSAGVSRAGHNALSPRYSFEDTHSMVGDITRSFASYWEAQCDSMKMQLVEMDTHGTGRVPLSKFYGTGLDADWRFGESEDYLRELGALDETSWRGKQVIIPNYIQAASNCIVSGEHYLVCCQNDCEVLLNEIEMKIAAPTASPQTILSVVGNMTSHISVDDDHPPALDASLRAQLAQISESHGGEVPIHGRLFAQWLHYAFPRECPFPHKAGTATASTPAEFGNSYIASPDAMREHAANVSDIPVEMGREELQWMSQWSPEEELVTDHLAQGLRAPWEGSQVAKGALALLAVAALLGVFRKSFGHGGSDRGLLPSYRAEKAHFV